MKNKFKAKKTEIDGIVFDSKLESKYYLYLKELKQEGKIKDFTMQDEYVLQPAFQKNGKKFREIKYIADFKILENDDSVRVVDTKGILTNEFKIKRKLFEYIFYELDLEVIKYVKKFGGWITIEEYEKLKRIEKKEEKKK